MGFNSSDKIILAVMLYLVLVTLLQFAILLFHPEFHGVEESEMLAGFFEFVLGAIIGYVGGKSETG